MALPELRCGFSLFPFWGMRVDLDGARIIDDLFPGFRRLSWAIVVLGILAIALLLAHRYVIEFLRGW